MSKALMLSYWNVNDPAFGGGRRINALIDALAGRVLLCQPGAPHDACETAVYKTDFGRRKRGINWGMFNFFWPANAACVGRLVTERAPPVIIMTSMWNYHPLRRVIETPIVLDAHDVNAVAVGERMGVRHPFTRMVRSWEARVVRAVDHLFACSERDREQFIALYDLPPERVTVVPNGVYVTRHEPPAVGTDDRLPDDLERSLKDATVLMFMGKLDYQPNVEALTFLNEKVMPALEQIRPNGFRLLVCGGPRPDRMLHPSVIPAGVLSTARLMAALRRADICLAPISSGSGTRLKILEYMASAKPVVTTAKGAEGIDAQPDRDWIVADPSEFAERIVDLTHHPERAARMGAAARVFVTQRYDWKTRIAPRWQRVLAQWMPPVAV